MNRRSIKYIWSHDHKAPPPSLPFLCVWCDSVGTAVSEPRPWWNSAPDSAHRKQQIVVVKPLLSSTCPSCTLSSSGSFIARCGAGRTAPVTDHGGKVQGHRFLNTNSRMKMFVSLVKKKTTKRIYKMQMLQNPAISRICPITSH